MEKNFKNQSMTDIVYGYLLERDIKKSNYEDMDADARGEYEFVDINKLTDIVITRGELPTRLISSAKSDLIGELVNDNRFVNDGHGKWDLNRARKSMVDVAYDYLKELKAKAQPGEDISLEFDTLYDEITRRLHLSATEALKKKGAFYTNLTLDGRFIILSNYKWDLRENRLFEECPEMNAFYADIDQDESAAITSGDLTDDEKEEQGLEDDTSDEDSDEESDE